MEKKTKISFGLFICVALSVVAWAGMEDLKALPSETTPKPSLEVNSKSSSAGTTSTLTGIFSLNNDIPPRLQWDANNGYCGEVSFINAGLYYGQYLSQFDVRAIASPNKNQNLAESQLLLGRNDIFAATQMHLNVVAWKTSNKQSSAAFLTWIKSNVVLKFPVIIGVFTNENKFYGAINTDAGDPDYDHIVTVIGLSSKTPLTIPATYRSDDILHISDHGLWTGESNSSPPYIFNYSFASFQGTRQQANASTEAVYTLPLGNANYGIAVTGVTDLDGSTLPVRLATSARNEAPAMKEGSNTRPAPMPLTLTITVSNLKPNVNYNLYRYNSVESVPNSGFNKNASKASQKWPVIISSGSSFVSNLTIQSNEIAIFRAVPSTAP